MLPIRPTLVEAGLVFTSRIKKAAGNELEGLVRELGVSPVPFGDGLAYATVRSLGDALLFVGEDFARTDITPA